MSWLADKTVREGKRRQDEFRVWRWVDTWRNDVRDPEKGANLCNGPWFNLRGQYCWFVQAKADGVLRSPQTEAFSNPKLNLQGGRTEHRVRNLLETGSWVFSSHAIWLELDILGTQYIPLPQTSVSIQMCVSYATSVWFEAGSSYFR